MATAGLGKPVCVLSRTGRGAAPGFPGHGAVAVSACDVACAEDASAAVSRVGGEQLVGSGRPPSLDVRVIPSRTFLIGASVCVAGVVAVWCMPRACLRTVCLRGRQRAAYGGQQRQRRAACRRYSRRAPATPWAQWFSSPPLPRCSARPYAPALDCYPQTLKP
eukprot:1195441-Prorocentrum_minimum.AAC.16